MTSEVLIYIITWYRSVINLIHTRPCYKAITALHNYSIQSKLYEYSIVNIFTLLTSDGEAIDEDCMVPSNFYRSCSVP